MFWATLWAVIPQLLFISNGSLIVEEPLISFRLQSPKHLLWMFSLVGLFHCNVFMLYNRLITNSLGYHGRLVREWMEREKQNSLTRWTRRNENSWIQFIEWYSCTPCIISLRLKHFHPILYHPPYSPFPLLILSFMRTWRATYISPHGVETYFAFVSDTEAVRVEDVLQQAIQSLNSL